MENKKLYTPDEIAEILSISRRTVYNYIHSSKLKATKIGRGWRISEKHLNDFLEAGEEN